MNEWTRSELNDELNKLDQTFWNRIMERNVNLFTKLDELNVKNSSLPMKVKVASVMSDLCNPLDTWPEYWSG